MYSYNPYYETYLAHHGIKGMKWGVRRYDNKRKTLFYERRRSQFERDFRKKNNGKYSRKELKRRAKEYSESEMDKRYEVSKVQKSVSKGAKTVNKLMSTLLVAAPIVALASVGIAVSAAKKNGYLPKDPAKARALLKEAFKSSFSQNAKKVDLKKIMRKTALSSVLVAGGKAAAMKAEDIYYDKKEKQ